MCNADKSVFSKALWLVFSEALIKHTFMLSSKCHNYRTMLRALRVNLNVVNLEADAGRIKESSHPQQRKVVAGF